MPMVKDPNSLPEMNVVRSTPYDPRARMESLDAEDDDGRRSTSDVEQDGTALYKDFLSS